MKRVISAVKTVPVAAAAGNQIITRAGFRPGSRRRRYD